MSIGRTSTDHGGLVAPEAAVELLATGFGFTEGPVWSSSKRCLMVAGAQPHTRTRG